MEITVTGKIEVLWEIGGLEIGTVFHSRQSLSRLSCSNWRKMYL